MLKQPFGIAGLDDLDQPSDLHDDRSTSVLLYDHDCYCQLHEGCDLGSRNERDKRRSRFLGERIRMLRVVGLRQRRGGHDQLEFVRRSYCPPGERVELDRG